MDPENATARSLVYGPTWEIEGMYACCASSVVLRLEADYTSLLESREALENLVMAKFGSNPVRPREIDYAEFIRYKSNDPAFAFSLDEAFGSVLHDMLSECADRQSVLFIATDNVLGSGDVHKGPFSTRGLVQWLVDQDIATVYKGATQYQTRQWIGGSTLGARYAHTPRRQAVSTWSWTLKLSKCRARRNKLFKASVKRYNNACNQLPTDTQQGATAW